MKAEGIQKAKQAAEGGTESYPLYILSSAALVLHSALCILHSALCILHSAL